MMGWPPALIHDVGCPRQPWGMGSSPMRLPSQQAAHALLMQTGPAGGAQSTPWGQPSGQPHGHPRQPPLRRRCLLMPTRQFPARQELRGGNTMMCSSVVQPWWGGQSKCPCMRTLQDLRQPDGRTLDSASHQRTSCCQLPCRSLHAALVGTLTSSPLLPSEAV